MTEPIGIVTSGEWKAEVYENSLPGDYTVRYLDTAGKVVGEESLSGVSSYHQRESEISDRLQQYQQGAVDPKSSLADAGEY